MESVCCEAMITRVWGSGWQRLNVNQSLRVRVKNKDLCEGLPVEQLRFSHKHRRAQNRRSNIQYCDA